MVFDIHGTDAAQPPAFQAEFREKRASAGPNVRYHGPYAPERVDALMQTVDVVVVPSIWWENAPTVMQEAARNGRAVVCSDIGGMAEMAAEIGAAVFPVGSAGDLALVLDSTQPAARQHLPTVTSVPDTFLQHVLWFKNTSKIGSR
jgi:glycosyltransferase involved in cell wall biosynthesis